MDKTIGRKKDEKRSSGLFSSRKPRGGENTPTGSPHEIALDELHKKYNATVVSRMQILNLNSLIVRRDVDPEETVKKAEVIALGVIEDNLRERDAFVHSAIGVYGFLFPGMSKKAAELKSHVIADQIARLINDVGDQFSDLEFEAKSRKRRGGSFADLVARQKGKTAASRNKPPNADKMRELELKKAQANMAIQQMTNRFRRDDDEPAGGPIVWWSEGDDGLAGRKHLPAGMTTVFRAMWNVNNKLLTAYSALPVIKSPEGHVESVVRVDGEGKQYAAAAACDRRVQEEALTKLHLLLDAGHKILLVLPVHFSTVDRYDYFVPYQQRLRKLRDKSRQLVVQELVGIPADLNGDRIRETVTRLRQVSRSVMVRVSPPGSGLRAWRDAGVHAAGFEFMEGQTSEHALLKQLDGFAERADEAGLKKFVYGLTTRSAAAGAVAAGFDYIEGNIVRPPVDSPAYVEPFESLDLFAGVFRR